MKVSNKPLEDLKQMIENLVQCSSIASMMQVDPTHSNVKGFHFLLNQATENQKKYCDSLQVIERETYKTPESKKANKIKNTEAPSEIKVVHYPIS